VVPPSAQAPDVSQTFFAPAVVVLGISAIAYGRTRRQRVTDPSTNLEPGWAAAKQTPRRFTPVVRTRPERVTR